MSTNMTGSEMQAVIVGLIQRHTGLRTEIPAREARLQGDLGLDSLSMIELAVAAEEVFSIRIPDDDLERMVTVGDIADYVQQAKA